MSLEFSDFSDLGFFRWIFGLSRSFCIHLHRSPSILEHSGPILNLEFSGVFASGILGDILKHFGQAVHASGPQAGAQGPGPGLGPGPWARAFGPEPVEPKSV